MKRIRLPENTDDYVLFPFYKDGKPAENDSARWGMTLRSAGSMRFRWAEKNANRENVLEKIRNGSVLHSKPQILQVQLDHTKTVAAAENRSDTKYNIADGIVSANRNLMPVVTIADCLALYFFDTKTKAFAVAHSGWKGTGIAENVIRKMKENFGSESENISVALSAHIRSCCYIVDEKRAEYFKANFGAECAGPLENKNAGNWINKGERLFRLSLEKANLYLLEKNGIKDENIVILDECTCCNEKFGSNRRETPLGLPFTVQAAFIRF